MLRKNKGQMSEYEVTDKQLTVRGLLTYTGASSSKLKETAPAATRCSKISKA